MKPDLRPAAYHEAGHAIVAWALGLTVHKIRVRADDGGGTTITEGADDLPLIDQATIMVAGREAEEVFDAPSHEWSHAGDLGMMVELFETTPEPEGEAIRAAADARARELLIAHKPAVIRLAERLLDVHEIDGVEFLRLVSQQS
jgi:ATP-dependent Zn protease